VFVFIFILASAVFFSGIYYVKGRDRSIAVFSYQNENEETLYKDSVMSALSPYIDDAVEKYYGEQKDYAYKDILKIDRTEEGLNCFEVTVRVTTVNNENKYSFGVDTIKILKKGDDIIVKDFNHNDLVPLKIIGFKFSKTGR
jgi:hypothetical protein